MKRKLICFFMFFAACCLWGCRAQQRVLCRFVTRVDITCDHDGTPIIRSYTDEDKMEAVLLYLRLLRTGKPPAADPDLIPADIYEITVTLSDGQQRLYAQKDHRYFRKGNDAWMSIPPEQASGLYALMRHYESDL